ncbi:GntR family transcriptional regulator [Marinitenerispora sediminis]|uniref:GntR family transcriptional regulator n=1 Tax=Marinitenerispora sediminis TaxID=1931232 RepID=A0A368T9F6_9ACTN|nr:GntR family transcriptional regulator [Marinitenerispora sediminis]RCV54600.1 GntR family transcriptional regulator [Marinitenerispora sediminis]RCV59845.1 GntR family transcriptional regulator [Marinitenerispora sediminis]RCV61172.1 GntR family transcriptional regulator [Marinitenerispora sediminis]
MTSKYRAIADDLRKQIASGRYPTGTTLPGYEALTAEYGVGRGVIRSALEVLEAEGLVSVAKRRGITVRERGDRRRLRRGTQVARDPARGYVFPAASRPDEPWQVHGRPRRETLPIPARPAELLGLDLDTPVLRRRRVTSPTGEPPFQLVDTWIHPRGVEDAHQVAEAHTGPGGYLDRLEEAGHGPLSWTEYVRVRMPLREEARLLEMPEAMPVLELARVGTSAATGAPIEVTVCVIPSDRVEMVSQLRRASSAKWEETAS